MATSPFASNTIVEHLLRGVLGVAAVTYAIHIAGSHSVLSLGLGICALVAFRGCPLCWTTGLIEMSHRTWKMREKSKLAANKTEKRGPAAIAVAAENLDPASRSRYQSKGHSEPF